MQPSRSLPCVLRSTFAPGADHANSQGLKSRHIARDVSSVPSGWPQTCQRAARRPDVSAVSVSTGRTRSSNRAAIAPSSTYQAGSLGSPNRRVLRSHSSAETTTAAVRRFFVMVCGPLTRAFSTTIAEPVFVSAAVPVFGRNAPKPLSTAGVCHSCGSSAPIRDSPAAAENHLRRITQHPPGRCCCTRPGRLGRRAKTAVAREGRLIRGPSWPCRA
jgi:hypothetical protein